MSNINNDYKLVQFICNKPQQGYVTPADFNLLYNRAQNEFVNRLTGEFQQYQPGRSQPTVSYGQNMTVRNRLTPVIYGYIINVDGQGKAPYMGDFIQMDAMYSIYGKSRVREIQQQHLFSVYNSKIDPIATNPIYLLEDTGFQFYPETLGQARASYIRNPPRVEWAYTLDSDDLPVYDPVNSIDCVFHDNDIMDILGLVLRMISVSLQDVNVAAYATELKNLGQ